MRRWLSVGQGHNLAYQKSPLDIRDTPSRCAKQSGAVLVPPVGNYPMGVRHLRFLPHPVRRRLLAAHRAWIECSMVHFVHALVYTLCHIIYNVYFYLKLFLNTISHASWGHSDSLPPCIDTLRAPQHLAVVFAWSTFNPNKVHAALQDVYRLAAWCATVGTQELTVYDEDGYLAQVIYHTSKPKAETHAPTLLVDLFFGTETAKNLTQKDPLRIRYPLSPRSHVSRHQMHVNILTNKDDKPVLTRALDATRISALTTNEVSKQLLSMGPMRSMPDMLVICDESAGPPCLHGFPCWMVRITTIQSLPTWSLLGHWTSRHFVDTLKLYTLAEQRYGA